MRFGGAYPFSNPAFPVHLFSGHTYNLPPGNYIVDLGRVSVLQTFDDKAYTWRTVGCPQQKIFVNSDGYNYRLVNLSGVVTGVKITNQGSGATNGIGPTETGVTVSFGSPPSGGRAAKAYAVVGGSINTTVSVTAAGSGYLVPPLILFDPPPRGGVAATAYAVLSGTGIGSVVVTNPGAGYKTAPNAYVIPQYGSYAGADGPGITAPGTFPALSVKGPVQFAQGNNIGAGSGAVLTLTNSGKVTAIVMTDYGSNYTSVPTVTISGAGTAAGTAIMSFSVTSLSVADGGGAVSVAPLWVSALGSGSSGLLQEHDGNNSYFMPRAARGGTSIASGAVSAANIEDPGFGLQGIPEIGLIPSGGTIWTSIPNLTASCGGVADTCILQPTVS
jgi:hypothetical protein